MRLFVFFALELTGGHFVNRTLIMCVCLLGLALTTPHAAQLAEKYTKIDGSANPEKVPAWKAWESVFRFATSDIDRWKEKFDITDAEVDILLKEAKLHPKREGRCLETLRALALKDNVDRAKSPAFVTAAIACRTETLVAGERVMAAMSPEGQAAMSALLDHVKIGLTLLVPEGEEAFFQQPR